jgi:hypothetical protein
VNTRTARYCAYIQSTILCLHTQHDIVNTRTARYCAYIQSTILCLHTEHDIVPTYRARYCAYIHTMISCICISFTSTVSKHLKFFLVHPGIHTYIRDTIKVQQRMREGTGITSVAQYFDSPKDTPPEIKENKKDTDSKPEDKSGFFSFFGK